MSEDLAGVVPGDIQLLTISQVGAALNLSATGVYDWVKAGKLSAPLKRGRRSFWTVLAVRECIGRLGRADAA